MAKRRREKDEEEDKPFKLPKFDEEAFLKRERRNIKTMFIAALFGILMALVCFGFWVLMGSESGVRWPLVLLVCIANAAFVKYIFLRLNIDISDFTKKNWFTNYAVYFFVWLIILILLVNPPVYDDERPNIGVAVLPMMQEPGGDIVIVAKITDNVGVNTDSIKLEIVDPEDNVTTLTPTEFEFDNIIVKYVYNNPDNLMGDFTYTLTASDVNGITRQKTGEFSYDDDVIDITSSRFENITSGDDITIEVETGISTNNFRVYYTLDDGEEINVNRKYVSIPDEYETSPEYEGWEENSNYTMKVYVEVSHYFTSVFNKYSNIVEDTQVYSVTTESDNDIGDETPPMPWNWTKPQGQQADVLLNYDNPKVENGPVLPYPHTVQAPGFETIIFIIALIAVVLIFKYKKKDKRKQK
jgi:hypothetical protein